jgi:hypothetical protein
MSTSTVVVPTAHASKYLQQLCKHWSHKLPVEFDAERGVVTFGEATATMTTGADALSIDLEATTPEILDRMKGVLSSHLDRFAFREAPLPFDWTR